MQGTTKSGYVYDIDDRILSDWRFTMALTKCQKTTGMDQIAAMQDMVSLLFGNDYDKFMKHIEEKNDGYVPAEVVMTEVQEIFESKIPKN